ncbi:MAG: cytochrome c peroxidase [Bryobacteraceae bacterium]
MIWLLALQLTVPLGLDAYVPAPEANPIRRDVAELGKRLFEDKRLSRDGSVSCATCHEADRAFTDDKPLAVGLRQRKGHRRTPTIVNRAYGKSFFWDGRAATLEEQVVLPIQNPDEMDLTLPEAVNIIKPHYPGIDARQLASALATYVRTILAGNSPYDRYVNGDRTALTPQQLTGLRLFRGKANCASCHVGPNLTDERFHNTGLAERSKDEGRAAATKKQEDHGAFKTPTLREVARRAPYMHDGSLATLADVIEHYDEGGKRVANADPEMRPLKLTADEKKALTAFLEAFSGDVRHSLP